MNKKVRSGRCTLHSLGNCRLGVWVSEDNHVHFCNVHEVVCRDHGIAHARGTECRHCQHEREWEAKSKESEKMEGFFVAGWLVS